MGKLFVGTSGWHYEHWAGDFYPAGLPPRDWFDHYATRFSTVEINNTFYRLPPPEIFAGWREQAPPGFCYAVKFSRYATHLRKLLRPAEPIRRFLEGALLLGPHLGPILVQLPPRWQCNAGRLAGFLTETPVEQRWVIEIRDQSWLCPEVYQVLRRHQAALCLHDLLPEHPLVLTAPFVYLRFHGDRSQADGGYPAARLRTAARHVRRFLEEGLDVYAYFNNDAHGCAPRNARDLLRYVSEERKPSG